MLFVDDWKCDQYRWINSKVAKLLAKDSFLRKTYFVSQQRMSRNSLYNVHAMVVDLPEFVQKIETHPDLLCICCHKEFMEEFDRVLTLVSVSPQLLSYGTTFNVSVLNFHHTLFIECPVVPVAFLIHERKFHECHKTFFKQCAVLAPTLWRRESQ